MILINLSEEIFQAGIPTFNKADVDRAANSQYIRIQDTHNEHTQWSREHNLTGRKTPESRLTDDGTAQSSRFQYSFDDL